MLCYHALSAIWRAALAVSPDEFAAQLRYFADRGYVGLTFVEAERRRRTETLPPRTLVVTFDDAFLSVLEARPVLAELGYAATVFVVSGFISGERLLEWDGITEWLGPSTARSSAVSRRLSCAACKMGAGRSVRTR